MFVSITSMRKNGYERPYYHRCECSCNCENMTSAATPECYLCFEGDHEETEAN